MNIVRFTGMSLKQFSWIVFAIISCTPGKEEEMAVRQVVDGIVEADNRSDLEAVLEYYHSQAILLPPGKDAIVGAKAIRENYESIFATSKLALTTTIDQVVVSGEFAVVAGRNKGKRLSLDDNTVQNVDDPFMMLLEKQEGSWKIRKLIWN